MVKLPAIVFNELMQLFRAELLENHELRNPTFVASILFNVKATHASKWVEEHPHEYRLGLLEGFEVDNTWKNF